jgi:hypothetical protein
VQQELEKLFKATEEVYDKKLNIIGWKGPEDQGCRQLFQEEWQVVSTGR